MIKLFILSPESTVANEKSNRPGDNALFVILKMLRKLDFEIIGNEVAILPNKKPLSLERRARAVQLHHEADLSVIMGNDTLRSVKSWFPVNESIYAPQPFFYINEPGRVKIELAVKLRDAYIPSQEILGFDETNKTIGG